MEQEEKNKQHSQVIKELVEEIVRKMGISGEAVVEEKEISGQNSFECQIMTEDSNYLIGQFGVNLQALQHIARILVREKIKEKVNFVLDVNSYRKEKNESLSVLAKNMAEKAILEKRAVVLRPMSPYERRLVHMELSQNTGIKTESIGEGENRRVVIKPVDLML